MQFAALVFASTALMGTGAVPAGDRTSLVRADAAAPVPVAAAQQQQQSSSAPQTTRLRDRGFGVGATLSATTRGAGGNLRYWFGDRVGVTLNAVWNRGYEYNNGLERTSSYIVAPSVVVMLTPSNTAPDIDLRPYVGVGLNYARASQTRTSTGPDVPRAVRGGQAFGGLEMTFRETPNLSIYAEAAYFRLPRNFLDSSTIDGLNFLVGFYYYF